MEDRRHQIEGREILMTWFMTASSAEDGRIGGDSNREEEEGGLSEGLNVARHNRRVDADQASQEVEEEGNDMPENRRTTRSLKRSRTLGEEASKSDKGSKKRRLQTQLTYKWLSREDFAFVLYLACTFVFDIQGVHVMLFFATPPPHQLNPSTELRCTVLLINRIDVGE
ncbi:hypothetical protein BDN71DRAFT_1429191 [Pleurotus eryngii]|uniref:Uncharacterized protein n=1 Tax=Pleurotus eryngii TaxID=5323 RepID=A0A9P6DB04_PLEER|nr:hypothetical protein BDN71DRAFT_1429191 [Pleurotus eryngii]